MKTLPADPILEESIALGETRGSAFCTTRWSMVLAAADGTTPGAPDALEALCQKYWRPIYGFIRRQGSDREDASDLTQAFFAHLLEKQALRSVDRQKGKFRTFLLAALTNFLHNDRAARHSLKRGGQCPVISLDEMAADERYGQEPADPATAEKWFDRGWAWAIVEHVLEKLRRESREAGKTDVLTRLEPVLTGRVGAGEHAHLAAELGMTEGAVRVALHRLRRRFAQLLREEISGTVASPQEVDEEIRHLLSVLGT